MMELRKRVEEDAQADAQNAEVAKKGPNFRKLQLNPIKRAGQIQDNNIL
jgi:hypothetical protein